MDPDASVTMQARSSHSHPTKSSAVDPGPKMPRKHSSLLRDPPGPAAWSAALRRSLASNPKQDPPRPSALGRGAAGVDSAPASPKGAWPLTRPPHPAWFAPSPHRLRGAGRRGAAWAAPRRRRWRGAPWRAALGPRGESVSNGRRAVSESLSNGRAGTPWRSRPKRQAPWGEGVGGLVKG